jgi:uncharacterized Rmd1/YagE family protein
MRCSSYCTATSYNIPSLVQQLIDTGLEPKYFDDVIYAQKEFGSKDKVVDIFYFPFGCVTVWGANEGEEKLILKGLTAHAVEEMGVPASDLIYCKYDENAGKTFIDEEKNEIILHDYSPLLKLSMSHALAQSVKLNILERSISNLLDKTAPIQKELAATGSVSLSKKDLSKQIGTLFNERYSINLHSDILDVPEFFWRRPSYEPLYLMTAAFQDIQVRQNIMNHRLDMVHELYSILSNELNYIHSTRLEMIIIVLIAIEVIIGGSNHNLFPKFLALFGL